MSFPSEFLDQLRQRLRLSQLVGKRVKLTRRGGEFVGLCPFHNEKTPSFTVSDAKNLYYCFGCGAKGDAIDFTKTTQGVTFAEAVEALADMAGLALPEQRRAAEHPHQPMLQHLQAVAAWYQTQLGPGTAGADAYDYLRTRGLNDETIAAFGLGFAPAPPHTTAAGFLRAQGLSTDDLVTLGIVGQSEGASGRLYERFRQRIIFPITDARGRVIAFGGRSLGDDMPKYLNSADGPLFHKGQVLYNLPKAREAVRQGAPALLVEGYLDVIALHQAGVRGAVAPLGTAVTEAQLDLLWTFASAPIVCLDGDAAGQRAMRRLLELALPHVSASKTLNFMTLPTGHDPDSLLQSQGIDAWHSHVERAQSMADTLWALIVQEHPAQTPEQRAQLRQALRKRVAAILDPTVRDEYQKDMAARIQAYFDALRQHQHPSSGARMQPASTRRPSYSVPPRLPPAAGPLRLPLLEDLRPRVLLAAVLEKPMILREVAESFAQLTLPSPALAQLQQAIMTVFFSNDILDKATLKHHLCDLGFLEVLRTLDDPGVDMHSRFARSGASDAAVVQGWREIFARTQDHAGLAAERQHAADALKRDFTPEAWQRYKTLVSIEAEEHQRATSQDPEGSETSAVTTRGQHHGKSSDNGE